MSKPSDLNSFKDNLTLIVIEIKTSGYLDYKILILSLLKKE